MRFFHKNNVKFNAVYFEIEFGDSGFSCKKWIWRVVKSILQFKSDSDHSTKVVAPTTLSRDPAYLRFTLIILEG